MNAVSVIPPNSQLPVATSASESAFALAQRKAKAFAMSTLVPAAYHNNVPNVLIAMEIANRIGANELMVMQNLHVVQGRPSWSSSFLIATVNACGRFNPLRFETRGTDPSKDDYACRAYAEEVRTGERCVGAWITWAMVKAEGWLSKNGSKWKTMPEQMFMYRAAGFWSRVYAPEVSMGILTREEVDDVFGGALPETPTDHGSLRTLEAELTGQPPSPPEARDDIPAADAGEVRRRLEEASNVDELNDAADLIRDLPIGEERDDLGELYQRRYDELQ